MRLPLRKVFIFLALLFAVSVKAEARGCAYDVQFLNNAGPSLTASELAMDPARFDPVAAPPNGAFEARSVTGVMWLRITDMSGCDGAPWMAAKFPYLTDTQLYAFNTAPAGLPKR